MKQLFILSLLFSFAQAPAFAMQCGAIDSTFQLMKKGTLVVRVTDSCQVWLYDSLGFKLYPVKDFVHKKTIADNAATEYRIGVAHVRDDVKFYLDVRKAHFQNTTESEARARAGILTVPANIDLSSDKDLTSEQVEALIQANLPQARFVPNPEVIINESPQAPPPVKSKKSRRSRKKQASTVIWYGEINSRIGFGVLSATPEQDAFVQKLGFKISNRKELNEFTDLTTTVSSSNPFQFFKACPGTSKQAWVRCD